MIEMAKSGRRFPTDALHILVLWSFAVAQPVYDLIGHNAEFFVAHRVETWSVLAFVLSLSIVAPAILAAVDGLARLVGPATHRLVHLLIIFALASAFMASVVAGVPHLPAALLIGGALAAGAAFTLAYSRLSALRSFVTVLCPSVLIFPALFVTFTPVSKLVWPTPAAQAPRASASTIKKPASIVFIVFDEFEASSLVDENDEIDEVRFPNFAALARDSWWFPRATTVWTETQRAVPAVLTGLRPHDVNALPNYRSHPDNLFSWLSSEGYRLKVTEPLTSLCPPSVCREDGDSEAQAFQHNAFHIGPRHPVSSHCPASEMGPRRFCPAWMEAGKALLVARVRAAGRHQKERISARSSRRPLSGIEEGRSVR